MSNELPDYIQAKWIRQSIQVSIEERPARIEDMIGVTVAVEGGNVVFTTDALANKQVWLADNANNLYQLALDLYIMRRWVYILTATRECRAGSFTGTEISLELAFEGIDSPTVYMSGGSTVVDPQSGYKWLRQSIGCNDTREGGKSIVTSTWRSYGEWERVKIKV